MKYAFDAVRREHCWAFGKGVADVVYVVPAVDSPDPIADFAVIHGTKQKIADAAAIARDTTTGKSATDQEKRDAMQTIVDRLDAGEWNAERTGGGAKAVDVDCLVAAIAATLSKNVVGVRAFVESKTDDGRKALAASEQFAAAYALAVAAKRPVRKLDDATSAELDAIA